MKKIFSIIFLLCATSGMMAQSKSFVVTNKSGNSQFVQNIIFQNNDMGQRFSWSTSSNGYQQAHDIENVLSITRGIPINLSLSSDAVSLTLRGTSTVLITSGNGSYTVVSDKPAVATALLSGSAITITSVSAGTAIITVTDTQSGQTARIVVTVTGGDNPTTDAVAVDLGLPSGTKWSDRNVGASKPEDYGGYYAWGETEEKEVYDWSTYIHCNGSDETCHDIGTDITGTDYDVAHTKWGGSWKMPNNNQIDELYRYCNPQQTTQNGVNGLLFTGLNGRTIFLPAGGDMWNVYSRSFGTECTYWSSQLQTIVPTTAYYWGTQTISKGYVTKSSSRSGGKNVRPVSQ